MSYKTNNILTDASSRPVPQAYNSDVDNYLPVQSDINGNMYVAVKVALPAGANIIGSVKLTDGTDALVINTNGSINIVNVDGSGIERFTPTNLGYIQLPNKVRDNVETSVGVTRTYATPMYSILLINDSATDMTLTVNGMTMTLHNGDVLDENFAPFTTFTTTAINAYRMWVRGV